MTSSSHTLRFNCNDSHDVFKHFHSIKSNQTRAALNRIINALNWEFIHICEFLRDIFYPKSSTKNQSMLHDNVEQQKSWSNRGETNFKKLSRIVKEAQRTKKRRKHSIYNIHIYSLNPTKFFHCIKFWNSKLCKSNGELWDRPPVSATMCCTLNIQVSFFFGLFSRQLHCMNDMNSMRDYVAFYCALETHIIYVGQVQSISKLPHSAWAKP